MVWSLLNAMQAVPIAKLLDDAMGHYKDDSTFTPGMPRDQAEKIIHAVMWMASCKSNSTSNAYAHDAFFYAVGEETLAWLVSRLEFEKQCVATRTDSTPMEKQND